jgi:FMN reductase
MRVGIPPTGNGRGGDLVVLVGNPRAGSRTRALAEAVAEAVDSAVDEAGRHHRTVLELAEVVGVTFGPQPAYGGAGGVADPFAAVRQARLLVVGTPTYKGTYTGLLKIFLDQYGPGALDGVVAVPVAIAASPAHRDAVAVALRDLLGELGARVPAPAFAVLEPQLAEADQLIASWLARHRAALAEALTVAALPAGLPDGLGTPPTR